MHIAVCNSAESKISDADVADYTNAIATQVNRDFKNPWNLRSDIHFIPTGQKPPPGCAWLLVAGKSDQAGALGYHTETPEGLPVGYVFAEDDRKYGANPSITLSHEVLELLLDPRIADVVFHSGQGGDEFHAKEACDAVEADELGYPVTLSGGKQIVVSDFLLPDYFDDSAAGRQGARFDFMGHLTAPFSLAPGGYQSVYIPGKGWTQRTDKTAGELAVKKGPGSRLAARIAKSIQGTPSSEVAEIVHAHIELFGERNPHVVTHEFTPEEGGTQ